MGLKVVGEEECGATSIPRRFRREDTTHVQHCKVFSNWAVLIGPSDWEDHRSAKEGSERYRIHNLPLSCSSPGLYELGIASLCSVSGRKKCKIKCRDVIVVYLGQADNVRTRLQHYGQAGSHLEGNSSFSLSQKWNASFQQSKGSDDEHVKQGPGLFTEIFTRGFSIVFRWAAMNSKARAEESEARLLKVFDYAWNRGGNVDRRPADVLLKMEKLTSQSMIPRLLVRWMMPWPWPCGKKPGITVQGDSMPTINLGAFSFTRNRVRSVYRHDPGTDKNRKHRAQKIINTPPQRVTSFEENIVLSRRKGLGAGNNKNECGVADGYSTCKNFPDKGRKRCNIHKGMRVARMDLT